eukprot:jgi/Bigna1/74272/fgenesh1_pg.28_\
MATFQTLFFLLSYAIINLACFILSIQGSPSFRPIWEHYSWHMAFFGFVACLAVMFYTHPLRAALSMLLCLLLIIYITYRGPIGDGDWGDVTQSLIFHQVRKFLLRLDGSKLDQKFWRPHILVVAKNPRCQYRLLHFANNLKKGGLLVLGSVLTPQLKMIQAAASLAQQPVAPTKGTITQETRSLEAEGKRDNDSDADGNTPGAAITVMMATEARGGLLCGSGLGTCTSHGEILISNELVWRLSEIRKGWYDWIEACKLKAFPVVTAAETMRGGVQSLLLASGLGALRPNTVLFEFYEEDEKGNQAAAGCSSSSLRSLSVPQARERVLRNALRRFPFLRDDDAENGRPTAAADDSSGPYPSEGRAGWLCEYKNLGEYLRCLSDTLTFRHNLLIARHFPLMPHYLIDGSRPPPAPSKSRRSRNRKGGGNAGQRRLHDHFQDLEAADRLLAGGVEEKTLGSHRGLGGAINHGGGEYDDEEPFPTSQQQQHYQPQRRYSTASLPPLPKGRKGAGHLYIDVWCLPKMLLERVEKGGVEVKVGGRGGQGCEFVRLQIQRNLSHRRRGTDALICLLISQVNPSDPKCNFRYADGLWSLAPSRAESVSHAGSFHMVMGEDGQEATPMQRRGGGGGIISPAARVMSQLDQAENNENCMFGPGATLSSSATVGDDVLMQGRGSIHDPEWINMGDPIAEYIIFISYRRVDSAHVLRSRCRNTAVAFLPVNFPLENEACYTTGPIGEKKTDTKKVKHTTETNGDMKAIWEKLRILTDAVQCSDQ